MSGNVTEVNDQQSWNALAPILVSVSGSVTEVIASQLRNALSPISTTVLGIVTEMTLRQLLKAWRPIPVTPESKLISTLFGQSYHSPCMPITIVPSSLNWGQNLFLRITELMATLGVAKILRLTRRRFAGTSPLTFPRPYPVLFDIPALVSECTAVGGVVKQEELRKWANEYYDWRFRA